MNVKKEPIPYFKSKKMKKEGRKKIKSLLYQGKARIFFKKYFHLFPLIFSSIIDLFLAFSFHHLFLSCHELYNNN